MSQDAINRAQEVTNLNLQDQIKSLDGKVDGLIKDVSFIKGKLAGSDVSTERSHKWHTVIFSAITSAVVGFVMFFLRPS